MIEDIIIAYNDSPNEESKHFFETCADIIRQKAVDAISQKLCDKDERYNMVIKIDNAF